MCKCVFISTLKILICLINIIYSLLIYLNFQIIFTVTIFVVNFSQFFKTSKEPNRHAATTSRQIHGGSLVRQTVVVVVRHVGACTAWMIHRYIT